MSLACISFSTRTCLRYSSCFTTPLAWKLPRFEYDRTLLDVDEDGNYETGCTKHQEGGRDFIEKVLARDVTGEDSEMDSTNNKTYPGRDSPEWRQQV